jgi:hypothetical protein
MADLKPLLFRADQCTKISPLLVSSGVKKPNPFLASNHLTVPDTLLENRRKLTAVNRGRVRVVMRDNMVG